MDSLAQVLAYGAGALFLGVALTLALIFALVSRNSTETAESCLGVLICLVVFALACFFFLKAIGA